MNARATLLAVLSLALTSAACQSVGPEAENKALVRRAMDELDKGNRAIISELYAPDFIAHFPRSLSAQPVTRTEFEQAVESFYTAFPDFRHELRDIVAEGDRVAVRATDYGTHQGEFLGIAPTGAEVAFEVIATFRIADGKIVEEWAAWDVLDLMQQLGAELTTSQQGT